MPVEGEAGEIGGDVNHEFMAVAAVGEDDFVWCKTCDYAANVEVAARRSAERERSASAPRRRSRRRCTRRDARHRRASPSISEWAHDQLLKCIAFDVDGELGLALVPGDREVNEFALAVRSRRVRYAVYTDDDFAAHPELPEGLHRCRSSVGRARGRRPVGRARSHGWVTGANEVDHHVRDAWLGRDFQRRHLGRPRGDRVG